MSFNVKSTVVTPPLDDVYQAVYSSFYTENPVSIVYDEDTQKAYSAVKRSSGSNIFILEVDDTSKEMTSINSVFSSSAAIAYDICVYNGKVYTAYAKALSTYVNIYLSIIDIATGVEDANITLSNLSVSVLKASIFADSNGVYIHTLRTGGSTYSKVITRTDLDGTNPTEQQLSSTEISTSVCFITGDGTYLYCTSAGLKPSVTRVTASSISTYTTSTIAITDNHKLMARPNYILGNVYFSYISNADDRTVRQATFNSSLSVVSDIEIYDTGLQSINSNIYGNKTTDTTELMLWNITQVRYLNYNGTTSTIENVAVSSDYGNADLYPSAMVASEDGTYYGGFFFADYSSGALYYWSVGQAGGTETVWQRI